MRNTTVALSQQPLDTILRVLFSVSDPGSTFLQVGSVSVTRVESSRSHDGVCLLLPISRGPGLGLLFLVSQELSIQSLSLGVSGDGDRGAVVDIVHTPRDTPSPPGRGRGRRREGGPWTLLHVLIQWSLIYGVPVLLGFLGY